MQGKLTHPAPQGNISLEALQAALACQNPACPCRRMGGDGSLTTHCPVPTHGQDGVDAHPSLGVRVKDSRLQVKCWAGCSPDAVRQALKAKGVGLRAGRSERKAAPPEGLDLESFATAKRLPLPLCRAWGLRTVKHGGAPAVEFPYYDESGGVVAVRYRIALEGPGRFRWRPGDKPGLYGLQNLGAIRASGRVLLVEGESDVLTLAAAHVPALGIPGKTTWKSDWAEALQGLDVILWAEPDAVDLVERVWRDLPGLRVIEADKIVEAGRPRFKDPSDAWVQGGGHHHPDGYRAWMEGLMAQARPAVEVLREHRQCWPPEQVAQLLDNIAAFIRRYVVLDPHQTAVLAAWVAHTWVFEAAETTPYIHITSPAPRCGKSRLLEVLELLVARPWRTGRTTAAALVRRIERDTPTLLLDEVDQALNTGDEYKAALTGVLNDGWRRGGKTTVCVGRDAEPKDFPTFSPKAIAGIGALPPTVADRSIRIELKRRLSSEAVEPLRLRDARPIADKLRAELAEFARLHAWLIYQVRPNVPAFLNDRLADACETLFAVADLAGPAWRSRLEKALETLTASRDIDDETAQVRLLADIRQAFEEAGTDRMTTQELIERLKADEAAPWGDWHGPGKPITPSALARLLRPLGIGPRPIRVGTSGVAKGYLLVDFSEAFARYVGGENPSLDHVCNRDPSVTRLQSASDADFPRLHQDPLPGACNPRKTASEAECNRVTAPGRLQHAGDDDHDPDPGPPGPGPWVNSPSFSPSPPDGRKAGPDPGNGPNGPDGQDEGLPFLADGGRPGRVSTAGPWPAESFVTIRPAEGLCAHCNDPLRGQAERSALDPLGRLFHPDCALHYIRTPFKEG